MTPSEDTGDAQTRVVAVDWSGSREQRAARQKIWLAEVVDGRLVRLECGRDRDEMAEHLLALGSTHPRLVVGLDFAFSFPAWFLEQQSLVTATDLWARAARDGERWLTDCAPPFWGRAPGTIPCPHPQEARFRRTELATADGGRRATSVFQLVGASQVGAGSVRGMALLQRLHAAGFSVWPFDPPGWPRVVEIYPRTLTGPVLKSNAEARRAYLRDRWPSLDADMASRAASDDNAFDAAVSALAMDRHREELDALVAQDDPVTRLEGAIWSPVGNFPSSGSSRSQPMRAVLYTGAGGPEVITLGDVPRPEVRSGFIRVRVHAAGVNRADLLQRKGHYPAPAGWPADIPGLEYAGEVEAVRGPSRWSVGDRVMGLVGGGAMAEMLVTHQDEAMPIPSGMSYDQAAAVPEVFLTAYDALVVRGRLAAGERVLIHAIGSGVGTAAAQIAKHLGATVIGTSRSAGKLARSLVYGVDAGIDTGRARFRDEIREPVHVVIDPLGGPALDDHLAVLAPRGRLVLIGFLAGMRTTADLGPLIHKRLEIIGTAMRSRDHQERVAVAREFSERMLPLFDRRVDQDAPLRPVLERCYPMAELGEAHRVMEANENFGKLVVSW